MLRAYPVQFAVILGLLAAACGEDMAGPTHVVNLRVLALRAAPPEVQAPVGEELASTVADALVVGAEGSLAYRWSLCLIPGAIVDGQLCMDPSLEVPLNEDTTEASVTIPVPSPEALLSQVPGDFKGFEIDLTSGVPIQLQLEVTDVVDGAEQQVRIAFKEIVISDHASTNANPILDGITWDGMLWDAGQLMEVTDTATGIKLMPQWSESTLETYEREGVEETETLLFSWFVDDVSSDLSKDQSDDANPHSTLTPGQLKGEEAERLVTLWLVARDGRGGVTWLTRQLRIVQGG